MENPCSGNEESLRRDQAEFRLRLHFRPSKPVEAWIRERDGDDLRTAARKLEAAWRKTGVGDRHCRKIPAGHQEWDNSFRSASERLLLGGIIMLLGGNGSGKTQLAATLIRQVLEHYALPDRLDSPELIAFYTTEYEVQEHATARFNQGGNSEDHPCFRNYRRPKLLVIDEIRERRTEYAQKMLEGIIDARYRDRLDTILISNLPPDVLVESLGASIADRIHEGGGAIPMDWPSFRRRPM